ncbi:actin-related protein [Scheffersomyces xylosifermentans]|uniref:actin-related protein n=1 Tax=Scheffersomyces xylosifermentans TaxID=1304137 RepID=UPI00315DD591
MSKQYLVIDNGSYNIKAGFNTGDESDIRPLKIQNALTKTKDGVIHIGNQYQAQTNNFSGILFRRPYDQGHLTSWETEKPIWDYTFDELSPKKELDPTITHLTLTESPFQLPQLSTSTDQIIFEEYGFNEYYRCAPASLVPWVDFSDDAKSNNDFMLVIDSGFTCTWIIPMIYQCIHWEGVRKLPVGGKVLNGLLRELISFRHYDITDEPVLVNTIKEKTCFLADDFNKALQSRQKLQCEFILPDFKTTTTGYVRGPKDKISIDTQLLRLSDERFAVPEAYYHPEILFDNNDTTAGSSVVQSTPLKNLTDLVVESIMACPEVARPLLSANISLVGGSVSIPNFRNRLLSELTKELPSDWFVKVHTGTGVENDEISWLGGINLTNDDIINSISISKKDYFEHGSNWCQKQFGFKNL